MSWILKTLRYVFHSSFSGMVWHCLYTLDMKIYCRKNVQDFFWSCWQNNIWLMLLHPASRSLVFYSMYALKEGHRLMTWRCKVMWSSWSCWKNIPNRVFDLTLFLFTILASWHYYDCSYRFWFWMRLIDS